MRKIETDKVGDKNINTFGSEMIIIKYRNYKDIDVYFPKYNWTFKHANYSNFKKGNIKCPYEPRVFGYGYLGDGKYNSNSDEFIKYYSVWKGMLDRCYNSKFHKKESTYKYCEVEKYLLNFQNAIDFFESIYYEVPNEEMHLDKDILVHGNKIYSRETCIFVPQRINNLFVKSDKSRGKYPIGVCYHKRDNVYQSYCNDGNNKLVYLGYHDTPEEAFKAYKTYKENLIKQVADDYKKVIPEKLYVALYNYEVDISD